MLRDVNNTSSIPHDNMIMSCSVKPGLRFSPGCLPERKKVIPIGNPLLQQKISLPLKIPPLFIFHHVHYLKLHFVHSGFVSHQMFSINKCAVDTIPLAGSARKTQEYTKTNDKQIFFDTGGGNPIALINIPVVACMSVSLLMAKPC